MFVQKSLRPPRGRGVGGRGSMWGQESPPRVKDVYQVGVLRVWGKVLARKGDGTRKCFARAISIHHCAPWAKMSYSEGSYIKARWLRQYPKLKLMLVFLLLPHLSSPTSQFLRSGARPPWDSSK